MDKILNELMLFSFLTDIPFSPILHTPKGKLFCSDALDILKKLPDQTIQVIFADPPYNLKKEDWDNLDNEVYFTWVEKWVKECQRILTNSGSFFIMGFSEILAEIQSRIIRNYFPYYRWIIWHYRNKPRMAGNDWTRSHEAILHVRKDKKFTFHLDLIREPYNHHTKRYPERSQGKSSQYAGNQDKQFTWKPSKKGAKPRDVIDIPAISNRMVESTAHPTQKPEAMLRKLLLATTDAGSIILDPFVGSGTTPVVVEQFSDRYWIGIEQNQDYCSIIKERLEIYRADPKPIEYYLQLDQKRAEHRKKVREG